MGSATPEGERSGLYLAIIAMALAFTVYVAFLLIGFFFRLLFIAAAVVLGVMAWRSWRGNS